MLLAGTEDMFGKSIDRMLKEVFTMTSVLSRARGKSLGDRVFALDAFWNS